MTTAESRGPGRGVLHGVLVATALALAGIHLYLAVLAPGVTTAEANAFLVVAGVFVGGAVLHVSPYWRPVLYLFGVVAAVFLGVLWLLGGQRHWTVGVLTGAVATAFLALNLYLFYREMALEAGE